MPTRNGQSVPERPQGCRDLLGFRIGALDFSFKFSADVVRSGLAGLGFGLRVVFLVQGISFRVCSLEFGKTELQSLDADFEV